jgi:hypothetical protein
MSQTNSLPSTGAHFISLTEAVDMTTLYRSDKETILATAYQNQDILPLSETFNRDAFDTLLAKEGCEGLRIYYGMDENLNVHAIIVAVNEENEDILPDSTQNTITENDIVEEGQRCPDLCPPPSALND